MARFGYINTRLETEQQAVVSATFRTGGPSGNCDPFEFLEVMEKRWGNANAQREALNRLVALRQGTNKKFTDFLSKFDREVAEAGIVGEDRTLIQYLGNAINTPLCHMITPIDHPEEYSPFCNLLLKVASRMEHEKTLARSSYRAPALIPSNSNKDLTPSAASGDHIDWEASGKPV